MTSWRNLRAASGRFTWHSPGRRSAWLRSTPHLMQVGVNLSSSSRTVLGKKVQSRCAAAQQLLRQLSADLDPYPPNLIIVVGHLIDPICHRLWQGGPGQLGKPDHLPHTGNRHDPREDRNIAVEGT